MRKLQDTKHRNTTGKTFITKKIYKKKKKILTRQNTEQQNLDNNNFSFSFIFLFLYQNIRKNQDTEK